MNDEDETQRITFTIANLRPISAKRIFALVDVEVRVADLWFWIMGMNAVAAPIRQRSSPISPCSPTLIQPQDKWLAVTACGWATWSRPTLEAEKCR